MNRAVFFAKVRATPFGGGLSQPQVDGLNKILDEWEARKLTDLRWIAYILATVFHETGRKMQPIPEGGGEAYLRSKPYYPYYGRGLVQITWASGYAKFGITNMADALTWPVALRVLFDGMINGMFTGSALGHWFSSMTDDPVNARRIVNGTDKADVIAGYHRDFLAAIRDAQAGPSIIGNAGPEIVSVPANPPDVESVPAAKPKQGWFSWFFGRKAS